MFGDQSHRIASGVSNAHEAARAVPDDLGHALFVVLLTVLSLIALLVILARLEPRKHGQRVGRGGSASNRPEQVRSGARIPPRHG